MAQATTAIRSVKRDVAFQWEGMDKKGQRIKGRSVAPDEAALKTELRRQGVVATRIKKQAQTFKSGGKVKAEDIAIFSRQLATMLAAGIPLVQAFEIVGNGHDKPAMQKLDPRHQGRHRGRHDAARGPGQAPAVLRRPVREPGRGRRAGRRARDAARQDRDLQGEERVAEEEGQEGAVLSRRGAGGRRHRHGRAADLRDSAVREPVQGLRRRPAGLHADGDQPVQVRADGRHLHRDRARGGRLRVPLFQEALAQDARSSSIASCSSSRSSVRS